MPSVHCGPIPSTYHTKLCLFIHPLCNQLLWWNFSGGLWRYSCTSLQQYPVRMTNFWASLERRVLQGKAVASLRWGATSGKLIWNSALQHCHLLARLYTPPVKKIPGILHLQTHAEVLRQLDTKVCNAFILLLQREEESSHG